jgi:hypothetical protein
LSLAIYEPIEYTCPKKNNYLEIQTFTICNQLAYLTLIASKHQKYMTIIQNHGPILTISKLMSSKKTHSRRWKYQMQVLVQFILLYSDKCISPMWQPPSSWCIFFDRIIFLAFKLLARGAKKKPWIGHYPQSVYLISYCWPKFSTQDWILQCAPRLTLPIRQHNCRYPPRVERYLLPRSAELYLYSRLLPVVRCWTCNRPHCSAQTKEGRQSLPFQPAKSSVPAPASNLHWTPPDLPSDFCQPLRLIPGLNFA